MSEIIKITDPILIVEDDPGILVVYDFYLEDGFSNILHAQNGDEGFKIFTEQKEKGCSIPVVITDIEMPVMNGLNLIKKITKAAPFTQIVIVSQLNDNSVALYSTNPNISYFPKPIEKIYLLLAAKMSWWRYREKIANAELRQRIREECQNPQKKRKWEKIEKSLKKINMFRTEDLQI